MCPSVHSCFRRTSLVILGRVVMFPKKFVDSIESGIKSMVVMAIIGVLSVVGLAGYAVYRIVLVVTG